MNDIVDSYLATWNATGAQRRAPLDQYWAGSGATASLNAFSSSRSCCAYLPLSSASGGSVWPNAAMAIEIPSKPPATLLFIASRA